MIDKINILGLWDERNYRISIDDHNLILVGENGCGKTTVLRIIYNALARNWFALANEEFSVVELEDGTDKLTISIEELSNAEDYMINISEDIGNELPHAITEQLMKICGVWATPEQVREAASFCGFPETFQIRINHIVEEKKKKIPENLVTAENWISEHHNLPVLYLPTYRRSERYMPFTDSIMGRAARNNYFMKAAFDLEVAKTGMKDVEEAIRNKIRKIRAEYADTSEELNLRCFQGILNREYENIKYAEISNTDLDVDYYRNPENISMVFNSISNTDFFKNSIDQIKGKLLQVIEKSETEYEEYDKIVLFFYQMLVERYERLKKIEEPLEAFFFACNKYMTKKKFVYLPNSFNYRIQLERGFEENEAFINLEHLSSGEKQVVSLFSYVYLSVEQDCMVIIDEPELSLSVEWQESILEDIIESKKCKSLIVATQSPFVYDNSLIGFAKPLETFLTLE